MDIAASCGDDEAAVFGEANSDKRWFTFNAVPVSCRMIDLWGSSMNPGVHTSLGTSSSSQPEDCACAGIRPRPEIRDRCFFPSLVKAFG